MTGIEYLAKRNNGKLTKIKRNHSFKVHREIHYLKENDNSITALIATKDLHHSDTVIKEYKL